MVRTHPPELLLQVNLENIHVIFEAESLVEMDSYLVPAPNGQSHVLDTFGFQIIDRCLKKPSPHAFSTKSWSHIDVTNVAPFVSHIKRSDLHLLAYQISY